MRVKMGATHLVEMGRKSCGPGKVRRAAYTTRKGVKVPAKCVEDTGKPGKTPMSQRVLPQIQPGFLKGWKHDMPVSKRHEIIQRVTDAEGCASTIRRLNLLANYTENTSPATYSKARQDMAWVKKQSFCHLKSKGNG